MTDVLQRIRDLQYTDKGSAEALLLSFVRDELGISAANVELRPSPVSLNSFNGYLYTYEGKGYFFKSHTETDTVISEYYNAQLLANAGYPVIQPIFQSTEAGKQFLLYELITDQSVFDLAWEIERQNKIFTELEAAQRRADKDLLGIYQATLVESSEAAINARAPIHQLFSHRITQGRLQRFYGPNAVVHLPEQKIEMLRLREMQWRINDRAYGDSLNAIIERSTNLLNPYQPGPTIVGHGDAHNGNVFFRRDGTLTYFDPAFAGRHDPLLDLAKPIFHNVFAMWMYFPREIQRDLRITWEIQEDTIIVYHDYDLPSVREMFLTSKLEHVLAPLLETLIRRGCLRSDWIAYLKSALFCCPFLTMDLCDAERFPPEISLLGLAMAVEMGAFSQGDPSRIDQALLDLSTFLS